MTAFCLSLNRGAIEDDVSDVNFIRKNMYDRLSAPWATQAIGNLVVVQRVGDFGVALSSRHERAEDTFDRCYFVSRAQFENDTFGRNTLSLSPLKLNYRPSIGVDNNRRNP